MLRGKKQVFEVARKRRKAALLLAAGAAVILAISSLFALTDYIVSRSRPMDEARALLLSSPTVAYPIGKPVDVGRWPKYLEFAYGRASGWLKFGIAVKGSRRSATAFFEFRRRQGVWTMQRAILVYGHGRSRVLVGPRNP